MRTKTGMSFILALLMIVSTFTAINATGGNTVVLQLDYEGEIDFIKSVWNETSEDWEDAVYGIEIGETVRFNISLTYYRHQQAPPHWKLYNIVIKDTIPECLEFADNVVIYGAPDIEEEINGNVITWNFTECGCELNDTDTMSIEFDATVIESEEKENQNIADVSATECSVFDHAAQDDAWVYVYVPPPVEVEKEVWDPDEGEWGEFLDYVQKGIPVKFRITITYVGYEDIELMKCMIVEDILPECCLEYMEGSEEFDYPDEELFDDPEIQVTEDLKRITFDWSNKKFNLFVDETIIIEFEAEVVEYCYEIVSNCAYATLWSCYGCPDPVEIKDEDCASVNCVPPPSTFEKKVWNPDKEEWVEKISGYVGDIITFKIELTYYGNHNFTDIHIMDQLPCCLEFDSSEPTETYVSEDLKTIWWNFTDPLEDGETLTIEFDAIATSTSGCGCGINTAYVTAYELQDLFEASDTAEVKIDINYPPCHPDVTGNTSGEAGDELTFYAKTLDPNGHDVYYMFEWGDETYSPWRGPYSSGDEVEETHSYGSDGEYEVRAKAKDIHGMVGEWTLYPHVVVIETPEPPVPEIEIKIKRGIRRSIQVEIKNVGEVDVNDITWNLTVTRRAIILKKEFLDTNGTIPSIEIGERVTVKKCLKKFGFFAPIEVNVTVNVPGLEKPIREIAYGFVILKWVRLRIFL